MKFEKYQHIERIGTTEVSGLLDGKCHVFYKIDGTNGQVYVNDDGEIECGSRNKIVTIGDDNAGFCAHVMSNDKIKQFLEDHPNMKLFGEWLCLSGDTVIRKSSGGKNTNTMTLRQMYNYSINPTQETIRWSRKNGEKKTTTTKRQSWWERYGFPSIFSLYEDEDVIRPNKIRAIVYSGEKEVYEVTTRLGFKIKATLEHPFYTPYGFKPLKDLSINDCVGVSELRRKYPEKRTYGRGTNKIIKSQREYKRSIGRCEICGMDNADRLEIHHKDGNHKNNETSNYKVLCNLCHRNQHEQGFHGFVYSYDYDKIISITLIGKEDCYDISMEGGENEANFVANGFIVHNCPHSLKTYRDSAWRKFYVFDVVQVTSDSARYLPYEEYSELLNFYGIDYIPPICTIDNPTVESLIALLDKTGNFLIEDGKGLGEGIVVKNYGYRNKFGRQTWGKIVRTEFKERNAKEFGVPNLKAEPDIEKTIVDTYVTEALVEKELSKIVTDVGEWQNKQIPRLLETVFNCLVSEETYNICKKFKNPTVDFKKLRKYCELKTKASIPLAF